MSVVVPFPEVSTARVALRDRGTRTVPDARFLAGPGVISWLRPAQCECCGRPTLAGRGGLDRPTLCGHCAPPNIA
jgi:hypothetical protein